MQLLSQDNDYGSTDYSHGAKGKGGFSNLATKKLFMDRRHTVASKQRNEKRSSSAQEDKPLEVREAMYKTAPEGGFFSPKTVVNSPRM